MTFPENMNLKFGGKDTNEIFAKMNLILIENTPEEIRDVTIEIDERLNGSWVTTEENEELRKNIKGLEEKLGRRTKRIKSLKETEVRVSEDYGNLLRTLTG